MSPGEAAALLARAYHHQRPWNESDIASSLDSPGTRLFAADHAVLIARILAGEAEILALATDPAQQRRGTARQLVAAFHNAARAEQAEAAFLEVAAANSGARRFYAAQGYVEAGRRPGYYRLADGSRDDAIVMRCSFGDHSDLTLRDAAAACPKSG